MNHDPIDESLLSAYLDDELSDTEKQRVEQALERSESLQQLLDELRVVRLLVIESVLHASSGDLEGMALAASPEVRAIDPSASDSKRFAHSVDSSDWQRPWLSDQRPPAERVSDASNPSDSTTDRASASASKPVVLSSRRWWTARNMAMALSALAAGWLLSLLFFTSADSARQPMARPNVGPDATTPAPSSQEPPPRLGAPSENAVRGLQEAEPLAQAPSFNFTPPSGSAPSLGFAVDPATAPPGGSGTSMPNTPGEARLASPSTQAGVMRFGEAAASPPGATDATKIAPESEPPRGYWLSLGRDAIPEASAPDGQRGAEVADGLHPPAGDSLPAKELFGVVRRYSLQEVERWSDMKPESVWDFRNPEIADSLQARWRIAAEAEGASLGVNAPDEMGIDRADSTLGDGLSIRDDSMPSRSHPLTWYFALPTKGVNRVAEGEMRLEGEATGMPTDRYFVPSQLPELLRYAPVPLSKAEAAKTERDASGTNHPASRQAELLLRRNDPAAPLASLDQGFWVVFQFRADESESAMQALRSLGLEWDGMDTDRDPLVLLRFEAAESMLASIGARFGRAETSPANEGPRMAKTQAEFSDTMHEDLVAGAGTATATAGLGGPPPTDPAGDFVASEADQAPAAPSVRMRAVAILVVPSSLPTSPP